MPNRQQLPYGSWPSPIDATALVTGASAPTDVRADNQVTWWSQTRPDQGGRVQVMRQDADGSLRDVLPDGWNARTRVHEYGGGAWWVHDGVVFATSWADQRVYRAEPDREPVPLTPAPALAHTLRYADGALTPDGSTVICVREAHPGAEPGDAHGETGASGAEGDGAEGDGTKASGAEDPGVDPSRQVRNEIVAFAAAPPEDGTQPPRPVVLVAGHDFVAAPRISPDGRRLAWLTWEHPDMPWDATALWVADLITDGPSPRLDGVRLVAGVPGGPGGSGGSGGPGGFQESLAQPEWTPPGELLVISDRSQWWNVYRVDGIDGPAGVTPELVPLHHVEAEVGEPAWVFGQSRYAATADGTVWFTYSGADGAHLVSVSAAGKVRDHVLPYVALRSLRLDGSRLVALASGVDQEPAVVEIDLTAADPAAGIPVRPLRAPRDLVQECGLRPDAISRPRHVSFPSHDRTAHAWLYLPSGADIRGPDDERPPLVLAVHGGPTAQADPSFRLAVQFWTTRGFAFADVNYGGSTGYGRAYRRLLDGAWGVVDVADVCAAATWLADQGLVDGARMAIRGGSAGGYTTLQALATTDVFAAGASHFGVADLAALARDTHKFESRYLDRLVGPWPEAEAVYRERSPLAHVDGFSRPLIVLQGDEDAVVPPAQAEMIVSALAARQVPHAYLLFAGEQHGFRRAESIIAAVEAELSFYGQVFGFTPAGDVPAVRVECADHLPSR